MQNPASVNTNESDLSLYAGPRVYRRHDFYPKFYGNNNDNFAASYKGA